MLHRAKNKLAELNEIMTLQVRGGHGEIYRKFDSSGVGKMTFPDFSLLVTELYQA